MNKNNYLISDAAKQVQVEAHVLRYWEEELELPIKRNELGHRYYTSEDVEQFKEIKELKERGLQLKAIRMILKDGKLNVVTKKEHTKAQDKEQVKAQEKELVKENKDEIMPIKVIESREIDVPLNLENREDKAKRLQWFLQQMIKEALKENNQELASEIKDSVVKELDYQFRIQEEKDDEKQKERLIREEEHYKKIDEMLRKKHSFFKKK